LQNPIQRVSLIYFEALASLRAWRNWLPLLIFWALQGLLLWILTSLIARPSGAWLRSLLHAQFGAESTEYPRFYLYLPDIHRRLYLVLAASLGVFLQGVSLLQLMNWHTGGKLRRPAPWRRAFARWPGLVLINLVLLGCFLVPLAVAERLLLPLLGDAVPDRLLLLAAYGLGFLGAIALLYAPFLYVAFSSGWWAAIRGSFRFARAHAGVSLILVVVPFLLALPIHGLTLLRRAIVMDFRPELMLHVLLLSSFLTLLLLFVELSTLVRYYAEEELRRPYQGEWDEKPEITRSYTDAG
jgi:hypothetical protein